MQQNFGYLGAALGNQAAQNFKNQQGWSSNQAQARQASSQYRLGRRGFEVQRGMDAQGQRDKMLGFGVNALAGLMR